MKQSHLQAVTPDYLLGAYNPVPSTSIATLQERIDIYHNAISQLCQLEQKAFGVIRDYEQMREEYKGRIFLKRKEIENIEAEKKEYTKMMKLALQQKWERQQGANNAQSLR